MARDGGAFATIGRGRLHHFVGALCLGAVRVGALCAAVGPMGCRGGGDAKSPSAQPTEQATPALGVRDDVVVATVGEERILAGELRRELAKAKRDWRRVPAHEAPKWELLKRSLLDGLVERKMMLAECKRRGIKVPDKDLEDALKLARAGYDQDRFEETLLETGQNLTQFKEGLREQLATTLLMRTVALADVRVTDAEAQARFEQNPQKFALPEAVRALHIAVRNEPEAKKLRGRLLAGEAMEALARKHSVSPDKHKGGDLGLFTRTQMPKVFVDTCFGLEPGKVSLVTPSEYGYHLFKVTEKRPAKARTFAEAKPHVMEELTREKRAQAEATFRKELEKRMPVQIDASVLKRVR